MRKLILAVCLFTASIATAGTNLAVSIGVNVPVYPQLVLVPGYPVYYAPRLNANYFFYDGAYWVFEAGNWYVSSWYNGPWALVAPEAVPVFILRVPVRYYHRRPAYFYGWRADAPPHWGEYWGAGWAQVRVGWDQWNYASVPAPAPLPVYQRQYSGTRYPAVEQQYVIQARYYHYQPHDTVVRQQVATLRTREAATIAPPSRQHVARATTERVRSAAPTATTTPAHARAAAPRAAPQTQSALVAAKPSRPAREQRNVARHEPAVAAKARPAPEQRNNAHRESATVARAPRMTAEHRSAVPRQSQQVSVAQSRAPVVQRAPPPQRAVGEPSRHAAVNAAHAPAVQHQPQRPQAQRAGPRMAEPKKDKEKAQG